MASRFPTHLYVHSDSPHSPSETSPTTPRSESSRASDSTSRSSAPLVQHAVPHAGLSSVHEQIGMDRQVPQDEGWPLLAQLMAKRPDFEAFSRFRDLNVKNLLYYQVQLEMLRQDLKEQEQRECRHVETAKYADTSMIDNAKSRQWQRIEKLRRLLREYNKALLLYSQISALPAPSSDNMKQLKLWLTDPECGNFCIGGAGSEAWGDLYRESELPSLRRLLLKLLKSLNLFGKLKHPQNRADLVAPSPHQNIDTVTRWIGDVLIPIWDHITSHIAQEGILIYSTSLLKHAFKSQQIRPESRAGSVEDAPTLGEKNTTKEEIEDIRIRRAKSYPQWIPLMITSGISTVVASVFPTIAIGVLTTADTTLHRILYIGGFSALFAIALLLFTSDTPRLQIFTATAAFSAVLVVFLQNQQ